jgi:hypothetical protein
MESYARAFSIAEIQESRMLQWAFGALIFAHYVILNSWTAAKATSLSSVATGTYACPPYFQSCGDYFFLQALPDGYSQTSFYMLLLGLLVLSVYFIYRKDWVRAHMALIPAFIWHTLGTFIVTGGLAGNYDYYLFVFSVILLLFPRKEFFLKVSVPLLYTLSTFVKIYPSWIVGTYFSTLKTGLPLFPDWSIPIFTNLLMGLEMIGAWFLLSEKRLYQRASVTFFTFFHLYSGILVQYKYPSVVLPMLLILFGPMYKKTKIPFDRASIFGWVFIALLICIQCSSFLIPGDAKLTLEGDKFGLYMFEANHQCQSLATVVYADGKTQTLTAQSISAHNRCDPYRVWFTLHVYCERNHPLSVRWTFDHSINGGPFLRIVDVPDACALQYNPFGHNEWIQTETQVRPIAQPVQNIYE